MDFPVLSVSAKLDADTSWPELVDGFVQFLRGSGFFIDAEWLPQYKEHKEAHERARQFYREWEASRATVGEDEVGNIVVVSGRADAPKPKRKRTTKKKKKAKK
jgi:hypothetical protein